MYKVDRLQNPPFTITHDGDLRSDNVVGQLRKDFYDKCYICENANSTDMEVEHLIPHKGDANLKYDWHNLFFSCRRCNGVKNAARYEGRVLDCTREDVVCSMSYAFDVAQKKVTVMPLVEDERAATTAMLIERAFNADNTELRRYGRDSAIRGLSETLTQFKKQMSAYIKSPDDRRKQVLINMLSRETPYSAFKKWIIYKNSDRLPELLPYAAAEH